MILQKIGVALRKESVDRNDAMQIIVVIVNASLSARRAWIEIIEEVSKYVVKDVALRKESVDRNNAVQIIVVVVDGRSPQGERG